MLLYYPFWMFMCFILHIYIIFGTNLLTGDPAHIAVSLPISVFQRKGISNGVQTEWNLRKRDFWNERDSEDLECKLRSNRGGQEIGGRANPSWARPLSPGPLERPPTLPPIYTYVPRKHPGSRNNFHRRNLLYPRDPILEPSSALCRRVNRPRRASTSTP